MKEKYDHRLLLKHLPSDFRQFLEHLQTLEYADKPDYAMLLGLFERTMKRRGVRESDPFDWEKNASASTNSSIAGEVNAASTNPAAVATGGGTNVALGSRNTAHLQATSAIPVSALAATTTGAGGQDNQDNNMQAAAVAAGATVDNQENLEPDNRKASSEVRAAEGGDPKAMPRLHLRSGVGGGGSGAVAGLNGSAESAGRLKAEVDKNCNANVAGRRSRDEGERGAAEKAVDPEGDAVMANVAGGGGGGSSANRDSGLFNLEMMTSRTEGDQEPPSPSPRIGGLWGQVGGEGAQDSSQPLSFNVKGTLERRQRRLQHMGNKTSFKSRFTLVGGGGGGDNSVTQMAMMDDDNVSAAYTHGGGNAGLTLHSRWKSQFDDSEGEGSENETEMKGEHLQSPEHKQAPPAAADAAKAADVISPRQPQATATTPTAEKQKLKLSPPKTSPPKLVIAAGSSSPRVKDPAPSPRPKGSSTSPEQQQRQQHSSSKQQQQPQQQQPSSPQVVIPPPPQLAPPPPPADFVPLQHSASAPSIPRSKAAPSTTSTTTTAAAVTAAAAVTVTPTTVPSSTAALASSAPAAPTSAGFTPPPPPQFAPPPPPSTVALDSKTTSANVSAAANGLTTLKTTMAAAAAAMTPRSPFIFARHPLQHSTSVSSGIAASNAVVRPLSQAQQQQISQRLEQNQAASHFQRPFLSRPPLAKSPLLQEPNLPAGGASKDDDDDDDEDDDEDEEDEDDEDENAGGDRQQPPDYVAAVCQYTTILKDAPPGFDNEEYEVNYLNLEKGTKSESADRSMPRTWSNPQLCESNDSSGGQNKRHVQQKQHLARQRQESESPKCYNLELKAKQPRPQPQQQDVVVRKISMPARLPSSFSTDFRGGKSPARDIEYIEDEEEDEGEEDGGGGFAGGTGQGVTGKFTFQGSNSTDDSKLN